MTDNRQENIPETSGPRPARTPPRKGFFQRWLTIGAMVIAGVLVGGAAVVYATTKGDKPFGRSAADLLLQLAFLLVAGTFLKWLIDRINKEHDKDQGFRSKQMDFLRRMREAHVRIASAQRLIRADPSPKTYSEQMRALMLVTPELEDIERDVAATTDLFCKEPADKENIQDGIKEVVDYLDDAYYQYAAWDKSGDSSETFSHQVKTGWLAELLKSKQGMPERYKCALDKSKGKIRSYVYSSGSDEGEDNGVATSGQNKEVIRNSVNDV